VCIVVVCCILWLFCCFDFDFCFIAVLWIVLCVVGVFLCVCGVGVCVVVLLVIRVALLCLLLFGGAVGFRNKNFRKYEYWAIFSSDFCYFKNCGREYVGPMWKF